MADNFTMTNESGDFTGYGGTALDGGKLSVVGGSLLNGTYCLSFAIDNTTEKYAYKNSSTQSNRFRVGLKLDPNSLSMAASASVALFRALKNGGSYGPAAVVDLVYSGGYQLKFYVYNDGNTEKGNYAVNISDAPHTFEIDMVRETTSSSADGSYACYVDGALVTTFTGAENYDRLEYSMRCLATFYSPTGVISGTYYEDDLRANLAGAALFPNLGVMPIRLARPNKNGENTDEQNLYVFDHRHNHSRRNGCRPDRDCASRR
jgi:hypothetical protein